MVRPFITAVPWAAAPVLPTSPTSGVPEPSGAHSWCGMAATSAATPGGRTPCPMPMSLTVTSCPTSSSGTDILVKDSAGRTPSGALPALQRNSKRSYSICSFSFRYFWFFLKDRSKSILHENTLASSLVSVCQLCSAARIFATGTIGHFNLS